MDGDILAWLKTVVNGTSSDDASASSAAETAALYTCPDCETTYVAEAMASCPECGQAVDSIPNERDLGLT